MQATYTKLNSGDWGIRVAGASVAPGATVTVAKKSGETKTETIGAVLWTGNAVSLCSIARSATRDYSSTPRGKQSIEHTYKRRYGWDGVRGSPSYYSSGMYDEES